MMSFIYEDGCIGVTLLTSLELSGDYPKWFSDQRVNEYNSHWSRPHTFNSVNRYIESLDGDNSKLVFAIYCLKNKSHIGNVSLQNIDHLNQSAEIAYLFGNREYWGKGYAYSASNIIIKHGFEYLNLNRIYLGCLEKNIAMCKLSEKLGFIKEGLRRSAVFSGGEFVNVIEYGLLKHEFK